VETPQVVGARLAAAARAMVYNQQVDYAPPAYAYSGATSVGTVIQVKVGVSNVPAGGLKIVDTAYCPTNETVPADQCAGATITGSDGKVYNATVSVTPDGRGVVLTTDTGTPGVKAVLSSYGTSRYQRTPDDE
jgi:hypothetical protein